MTSIASRPATTIGALMICVLADLLPLAVQASPTCPDEQASEQIPKDLALCRTLEPIVRQPSAYPLDEYETALSKYLDGLCHRDLKGGCKADRRSRATGPWTGTYRDGKWTGQYYGTHAPVLVWYSPDFYAWLKANRPEGAAPAVAQSVPNGAIMVKEMYPPPAAACG